MVSTLGLYEVKNYTLPGILLSLVWALQVIKLHCTWQQRLWRLALQPQGGADRVPRLGPVGVSGTWESFVGGSYLGYSRATPSYITVGTSIWSVGFRG